MTHAKWLCIALLCSSSMALAAVPTRTFTFTLPNKALPVLEWRKTFDSATMHGFYGYWGDSPLPELKTKSPDGRCTASRTAKDGGTVQLECAGQPTQVIVAHKSFITRLAFSPDSRFLVSGTFGGSLKWMDTATGKVMHDFYDSSVKSEYRLGHAGQVVSLIFAADTLHTLITFAHDGSLKRWNTETGQLEGALYGVIDLQPAQDSQNFWIAKPTALQEVRSSDFSTLKRWEGMSGPFELSADEKFAKINHKFVLDLETGKLLGDGPALAWAVSPDGKIIAAHRGHKVNLYALESQKLLNTLEGFYPERYITVGYDEEQIPQARLEFSASGKNLWMWSALQICCGGFMHDFGPGLTNLEGAVYNLSQRHLSQVTADVWRKAADSSLTHMGRLDGENLYLIGYDQRYLALVVNNFGRLERTQEFQEPRSSQSWQGMLGGQGIEVYQMQDRRPEYALNDFFFQRQGEAPKKLLHTQSTASADRYTISNVIFSSNSQFFTLDLRETSSDYANPSRSGDRVRTWPVYAFESRTGKPLKGFPRFLSANHSPVDIQSISDDGRWILSEGSVYDLKKAKTYPLEVGNLEFVQWDEKNSAVWFGNGERLERWNLPH